jgi:hypothetical protein
MMRKNKNLNYSKKIIKNIGGFFKYIAVTGFYLLSGCGIYGPVNDPALTMRCITEHGDTMSVFPTFQFVFSDSISDSSVSFSFSPKTSAMYGVLLNATHDTVTLQVTDALSGNTRYTLRLQKAVTAVDGDRLAPSDDSITFITWPLEMEPNDAISSADSLKSIIFGTLPGISDTDVFFCPGLETRAVYLKSIYCQDSFYIIDAASKSFSVTSKINQDDTLWLPDSCEKPIYIFVIPSAKGSEGAYQLGNIKQDL